LLAQVLNTVHNLHYYLATMRTVRSWIRAGQSSRIVVSPM
jgi:queuine/archaeosine tRNA-ribosyltransferase